MQPLRESVDTHSVTQSVESLSDFNATFDILSEPTIKVMVEHDSELNNYYVVLGIEQLQSFITSNFLGAPPSIPSEHLMNDINSLAEEIINSIFGEQITHENQWEYLSFDDETGISWYDTRVHS